jgi:phosphocarrier protein FPr
VIGLVIVSHSAALAEGVAELAREMGGEEVRIAAAGGLDDGAIGTDAARVMTAVESVRSDEGVLVLMDLGSALMSAEMAVEMLEPGGPVALSAAPLVEGAVAAAARARGGASLDEVAAEARGALAMKTAQLGEEDGGAAADGAGAPGGPDAPGGEERRLVVENQLGLHARPAARFVAVVAEHDARVSVRNLSRGTGPADGRSLTALATLGVRSGDEIAITAAGPTATAALDAITALAADNFGDPPTLDQPQERARPLPQGSAQTLDQPQNSARPLSGVAASGGVAIGPARRLVVAEVVVAEAPEGAPEEERARLDGARAAVRAELEAAKRALGTRGAGAEAEIFTAHALLVDDAALVDPAHERIAAGQSAGRAWQDAAEAAAAAFRALDDDYLRERAVDVEDVGRQVLAKLAGKNAAPTLEAPGIVIADELTPGEAAALDPERAYAIATARGGATGHAAIVAKALGIPAVVGLGPAILAVADGTPLALDGGAGTVEIEPDDATTAALERRRDEEAAARAAALDRATEPVVLPDGRHVEVVANVGSAAEARQALAHGAEGVGLLRTEFLFLDRATPPSEDEQVATLTEIAQALQGRPVIVRTLDAGADKPLPFLRQAPEENPFLGLRGIRLSLAEPDLFRAQLRAILRVAADHPLKLMFPMVATLTELRAAKAALDTAREELGTDTQLDVGVMVEVPALALQADRFAPEVDFFSVGTNDLSQYTMAAERGNAALAGLLGPEALEPVLDLIARVVRAADAHGRWVGVCGELAGDPDAARRLTAIGVSELSMAASRIPDVKAALRDGAPPAR